MNPSVTLDLLISNSRGNTLNIFYEDVDYPLILEAILRGYQVRVWRESNFSVGRGISCGNNTYGVGFSEGSSPGSDRYYMFSNEWQSTIYEEMIERKNLEEERVLDSFFTMYISE